MRIGSAVCCPLFPRIFDFWAFLQKRATKNLFWARFRGPLRLNLVLLESHTSPLSISITYTAPGSPHGTRQGLRPWTRFCALRAHMVANGLNRRLGILTFSIFNVFVLKKGQFSHFHSIFGSFSKFRYLINPLTTKDFRFLSKFFSKNFVLKNWFWHDSEVCWG